MKEMMSLANDDTQTYCILNWLLEFWGATSGLVFLHQTGRTDPSTEQDAMDEMSSNEPDYQILWTSIGKTECQYSKHKIFIQPYRRTFSEA